MEIIFEEIKTTGIIKLNRPKALNALNLDMSVKFSQKLTEWRKKDKIDQVLLIGAGKHFCAGGDVKSLSLEGRHSNKRKDFFLSEYKLNYQINNFPKPYLSIWNGVVMGGGVGLSLYGNYRIVTEKTKLAMPESAIGFFPDVGASFFLSRLKNNFGLFLGLTGNVIHSKEILSHGLGTHYCLSKDIDNLIDEYINKKKINNYKNPFTNKNFLDSNDILKKCFTGTIKDIFGNLKKNGSDLALSYLEIMSKKCPMSLAVTTDLLRRGKNKNLKECLEMEFKLSQNMVYRNDFDIGIDAVLISKHNIPIWQPSSINDITKEEIDHFFELETETLKL